MALQFEDSKELPTGRRAINVPEEVLAALKHSAKAGVAKTAKLDREGVEELRTWLRAAPVKKAYEVTTEAKPDGNGKYDFKFAATAKPAE